MKLLILTQYFPPETGAPQNRLFELAVRLKRAGVEVTVLTAMPNYPRMEVFEAYRGRKYVFEKMEGICVHRTSIHVSASRSVPSRLLNYFSFVYSSLRASSRLDERYDILFCESPPLFLGYSALALAKRKRAKLVFNVSDLWPESAEKLGVITNRFLLGMAYRLERKLYLRSALVTGQTQGICASIAARFPSVKTWWLPNGADLSLFDPARTDPGSWRRENGFTGNDVIFLYAGIIGIAQGLTVILDAARQIRDKQAVKFVLMGEGPEKEKLRKYAEDHAIGNVSFLPAVSKEKMPMVLRNADAVVVPLRKLDLFKGAIPSKIFEALAMERPVILGVDGEARELFERQGKCAVYFQPENSTQLAIAAARILDEPSMAAELGRNGRAFVDANFNRDRIATRFLAKLRELLKGDEW